MSVILSEHLPLIATAPDGIPKLRDLILELAVRGKLVPQDPQDEPASELLKRIALQRARLESEGVCKKSKATPLDAEIAPPFELPAGWVLSQLSDLTLVLNGRAYSKDELLSEGVPVLRVGNLFTSNHWYYSNLQLEEDKYCDKDDLLYSWSASFGPFIWQGPKVIYHYHIWKLRLFDESSLSKEFFYKFLLEKTAEIKAAGHGVSMIHMTKEKMEKILVPVPPLAEQRRIVAKVDELMALCDRLEAKQVDSGTAHARLVETLLGTLAQSADADELAANWQLLAAHFDTLFATDASVDAIKRVILQLAMTGKLVLQDIGDEPASMLLEHIEAERNRKISEGKLRRSLPSENARDYATILPAGWSATTIGMVSFVVTDGTHKTPKYTAEGVKFVSAKDVRSGALSLDSCKFISHDEHEELTRRCKPEAGDILISKSGSIGTVVTVDTNEEFSLFESLALVKFPRVFVAPPFLKLAIQSTCNSLDESQIKGVAVKHLHLNILRSLPISLPPLAEQHRIVAKVDELMALCDRLKADLVDSRSRQARLADTLIAAALEAA